MNKRCARCDKTVYPIEELKCLDKLWHKQCFKCQSCGMTLNMRNYKGFNKDPYCEAHVPKAKATSVAETPELKRIAENTKIQSNVKYHADFEKTKGKLTQVCDDPEMLRIKQNSQIISNVAYHGDLKKKAEMELKRPLNAENGQTEETNQSNVPVSNQTNNVPNMCHVKSADSRPVMKNSPYSARQSSTLIYSSNKGPLNTAPGRSVGSIADIDPVNHFYGSLTGQQQPQQQQQLQQLQLHQQHQQQKQQSGRYNDIQKHKQSSQYNDVQKHKQSIQYNDIQKHKQSVQYNDHQRIPPPEQELSKSGVNWIDPPPQMNNYYGSYTGQQHMQPTHQPQSGNIYRAMYDYDARESDEVSFQDGDIILNCVHIHDGWMSGVVQRTGQCGLLPANYVESIII